MKIEYIPMFEWLKVICKQKESTFLEGCFEECEGMGEESG